MKSETVKVVDVRGRPKGTIVRLQPEGDDDIDTLNNAVAVGKLADLAASYKKKPVVD